MAQKMKKNAGYIFLIGLFIFWAIVFSLSSCSPQFRLNKLIKKNPQLVQNDTLIVSDTVITRSVEHDSIFSIRELVTSTDTIIYQKGRLTQKIYYYRDSLYFYATCSSDTIIKNIPVIVEKVVYKENQTILNKLTTYLQNPLYVILLILIVLYIFFRKK